MGDVSVLWLYLGAVGAIFLLNAVQWSFSRDWLYGLFTLQTLIWFAQSIFNRVFFDQADLTESQMIAMYAVDHGLINIIYLSLADKLFNLSNTPPSRRWVRWSQLGLGVYMLVEVALLLTNEPWHLTAIGVVISTGYWGLLIFISVLGIILSLQRKDAVGWLFRIGSFLLLISKFNLLFYYVGFPWEVLQNQAYTSQAIQLLGGGRIIELLCFSLCLLFHQRQLAVTQAVEQTRREGQLTQDRLKAELRAQRLEQEKTDVQLRALQVQVNPHFLFNSLNSLSSLIEDEPERASQFVDQLSLVYRYLLRANDQPLTTLANELDFIKSYYHLLKTRHGDGLSLTVQVAPEAEAWLLPPLTLQLLVENAVKHNVTLTSRPLYIDIFTDGKGQLTVSNTLQRKNTPILSNGVGLSTILAQYQKFDYPAPVLREEDGHFNVVIPLIHPSAVTAGV